jgi:heme-degrading monooxygenase HmoA
MGVDMGKKRTGVVTITSEQQWFTSWALDVLVYVVVLNLFVEFVDAIVIESFWISILTAVLLQALLTVVVGLESHVGAFFEHMGSTWSRVTEVVAKFVILFTSKLLILEIVNFVFGDQVELGHFVDVLVLIIAMMGATAIVRRIYAGLGQTGLPSATVARIWKGEVPLDRSDEYLERMRTVAIPDYRSTEGNEGAFVLQRDLENSSEFLMLTFWESRDAIKAFAGDDISVAKYYDFDADVLLEMNPRVEHFAVYDN